MTKNQIEYLKLKETERANKAQEFLTSQRDTGTIQARQIEVNEQVRHNQATEAAALEDLGIKSRTAAANELNAVSNERNAATNERNAATNEENAYNNYLQALASQASAGAAYAGAAAAMQSASAAYLNAETSAYRASEEARHNLIGENVAWFNANTGRRESNAKIGLTEAQTRVQQAQKEYVEAQTRTEAQRPSLIVQQTQTERARQREYGTSSYLKSEQAAATKKEAQYIPLREITSAAQKIGSTIESATRSISNLKQSSSNGSLVSKAKKVGNNIAKSYLIHT